MRVTLDNNVLVSALVRKSPGFAWLRPAWRELILAPGDDLMVLNPFSRFRLSGLPNCAQCCKLRATDAGCA